MDPLSAAQFGIGAIQGLSSIFGNKAAALRRQQQMIMGQRALEMVTNAAHRRAAARQGLLSSAGVAGSDLLNYGRGLGSTLAASGVTNSSALAGAVAAAKARSDAQLLGMGQQMDAQISQQNASDLSSLRQMQYGNLDEQIASADAQRAGSIAGLANLAKLGQEAFGQSPVKPPPGGSGFTSGRAIDLSWPSQPSSWQDYALFNSGNLATPSFSSEFQRRTRNLLSPTNVYNLQGQGPAYSGSFGASAPRRYLSVGTLG